jgi:hypothetical protein
VDRQVGGHGVDLCRDEIRLDGARRTTPRVFCAVIAVMADRPKTPWAAKVFRSA